MYLKSSEQNVHFYIEYSWHCMRQWYLIKYFFPIIYSILMWQLVLNCLPWWLSSRNNMCISVFLLDRLYKYACTMVLYCTCGYAMYSPGWLSMWDAYNVLYRNWITARQLYLPATDSTLVNLTIMCLWL